MKKYVLPIIAGILLLSCVVACNNTEESISEKTGNSTTLVYRESEDEPSNAVVTEETSKRETTVSVTKTSPKTTKAITPKSNNKKTNSAVANTTPKTAKETKINTNSQIVYITETGKKYHSRKNCSGLSNANSIFETTLSKAKESGLQPCKKCH